ncbi:MAG: non-heme iron oxygenase ferredoxin subunit [Planctomycetes bacterium]|nr:non-heme iron oxygenase ferredoxin subunit [Planctomycetota bacterium]
MVVYHFACNFSNLTPNVPYSAEIEDRFVMITLIDGEVYCIDDTCTHDGGTLGDGEVSGHCIACPRHGAKFDLRTGDALSMPATEPTVSHEVKIEDGKVFVKLND